MSTEHNGGNQSMGPILCRNGCGFYGNSAFDGMCSKCYKDAIKRRQQNPAQSQIGSGRSSPNVPTASELVQSVVEAAAAGPNQSLALEALDARLSSTAIAGGSSTIEASASQKDEDTSEDVTDGAEASPSADKDKEDSDKEEKKPKKNRCHTCKKKVGLTGFECRCGGLYCSLHRYSDKHSCTFNYKELAQEQIRKNNPVVVGAKIQKI